MMRKTTKKNSPHCHTHITHSQEHIFSEMMKDEKHKMCCHILMRVDGDNKLAYISHSIRTPYVLSPSRKQKGKFCKGGQTTPRQDTRLAYERKKERKKNSTTLNITVFHCHQKIFFFSYSSIYCCVRY